MKERKKLRKSEVGENIFARAKRLPQLHGSGE
jgi:hypothetical protein